MNHAELAAAVFSQGLSCSQAVFSVYAAEYGLDKDAASKIASGFGGGMGRMGQTCGAVTGAYMVIGLKYGAATGDREAKEKTYRAIREFAERFKVKQGSLVCTELLGCDISTPEGFEEMKKLGLHEKVCTKLVRDACEILDEMLKV
jgi:C_GCAxxG_C_C family probable redox protein